MKKPILCLLSILLFMNVVVRAEKIYGKITDKTSGKKLTGVNITVNHGEKGSSSDQQGNYNLLLDKGTYQIVFSHVGYEDYVLFIHTNKKNHEYNINLIPKNLSVEEVVITASRTAEYKTEVPGRIDVISPKAIGASAAQNADNLLSQTSGITVDRSMGIFGKSVVSIRGVTGSEQGRVLVMQNGIPINKTDGGSVNWNRFMVNNIEKIEVFKGPGSSIFGSNAMGGVINIITTKNLDNGINGMAGLDYGTYNTFGQKISLNGKLNEGQKGFYWDLNAFNRNSDGYITLIEKAMDEYTIKSGLKEKGINVRIGYDVSKHNLIELEYNFYDDKRGQGEKIKEEQTRDHDTHYLRAHWKAGSGFLKWNISTYFQHEDYLSVREKQKKGKYSKWYVDSNRDDLGIIANFTAQINRHHISFGGDFRLGKVNGADVYKTSTDIVHNLGKMNNVAFYFQDKISIIEKLKLTVGGRLDFVKFYDGAFFIDEMTNITSNMENLAGNFDNNNWKAFTPKAAIHYNFTPSTNTYFSYSQGFRAATLDDLCRSGWISGGFKIANPNLGPEKIYSYEWGMNIQLNSKLSILPSVYYMIGKDFLYYLNTDKKMGKRFIRQKQNITEVEIYGFDLDVKYKLNSQFSTYTNYTYNHSKIKKFDQNTDLVGKALTYTPKHMVNAGFIWKNKIINSSVNFHYQDKRYSDDANKDENILDDYATFDFKVWKKIQLSIENEKMYFEFSASVNNVFNKTYLIHKEDISMGRFIMTSVKFFF
jgi:iron complex outermembrane receptor protein